jgi:hypothetical protein
MLGDVVWRFVTEPSRWPMPSRTQQASDLDLELPPRLRSPHSHSGASHEPCGMVKTGEPVEMRALTRGGQVPVDYTSQRRDAK